MKRAQFWRWLAVGIVFIVISIPGIFEKVPPNRWYGFRVAKTLSDERIWYAANRVMGIDLLLAGLAIMLGAFVVTQFVQFNPRQANRICFSIFLACTLAALVHGYWALSRM
ncbi:MAG: SdpI family protein [Acidobacteria bacterium]|nr:SdpI family protein [Acidobacteriota bacterium]